MCIRHIITSDENGNRIEYDIRTRYNKVYLLNSPIITGDGTYVYRTISVEDAQEIIREHISCWESAIGHASTAQLLYHILDADVTVNRISVDLQPGDAAIVLRLGQRLPEGTLLTVEQLKDIKYTLGLLIRIQ
jgi:hypothetical protein